MPRRWHEDRKAVHKVQRRGARGEETHGSGEDSRRRRRWVAIAVAWRGRIGDTGCPVGDLYVCLAVKPHPSIKRDGLDLYTESHIHVAQAILGCEIEVETLDGKQKVSVEAGTQPGSQVRIKGAGVPKLGSNAKGDFIVVLLVDIPTKISDAERECIESFAKSQEVEFAPQKSIFQKIKEKFES